MAEVGSEPRAHRWGWRHALDETYRGGLVLKGLDGLLESVAGVLLIAISAATFDRWAHELFHHELLQDPNDFIARHVLRVTAGLRTTRTFGAVYLISHGVAKLVMVAGLWRRRRWAYPFALAFLGGFVVYQLYRMTFDPSVGLALLTVFDVFIIWLVWRDFREYRASRSGSGAAHM
jgi:uncharacterized membrane protein